VKETTTTCPNPRLTATKRWGFKAVAVTLSLLLCFLCLELGLRGCGPEYYKFAVAPVRESEVLDADSDDPLPTITFHGEYYSNPRGYFDVMRQEGEQVVWGISVHIAGSPRRRIPDYFETPEQVRAFLSRRDTILALGDSFTLGQGVRYQDTYVRQLEKLLAKDGKPVGITNTGDGGFGLEEVCTTYERCSSEQHYPLVLYGFVLNDFGMPAMDKIVGWDYITLNNGGYRYNPWRRRCASINFICCCIERIRLDQITKKSYFEAFQGRTAGCKFALLWALNKKIRADGAELVIVLFPLLYEFDDYPFKDIHQKIVAFCRSEHIPVLDLLPAFSKRRAEDLWVHPTDHHPNEIAHRIAAREIYYFLKSQGLLEDLPTAGGTDSAAIGVPSGTRRFPAGANASCDSVAGD